VARASHSSGLQLDPSCMRITTIVCCVVRTSSIQPQLDQLPAPAQIPVPEKKRPRTSGLKCDSERAHLPPVGHAVGGVVMRPVRPAAQHYPARPRFPASWATVIVFLRFERKNRLRLGCLLRLSSLCSRGNISLYCSARRVFQQAYNFLNVAQRRGYSFHPRP
jgi:hypothetical protein